MWFLWEQEITTTETKRKPGNRAEAVFRKDALWEALGQVDDGHIN